MEEYQAFIQKVHSKTGLDLSLYKEAQMKRRLTSLRNKRGFRTFDHYFDAINKDQTLLQEFLDKVTINVSEFYRNPSRWSVLEKEILPKLKAKKDKIKIWSAACSTGEEPYTLAIIASKFWQTTEVDILATDIDDNVIARAKQGIYNERAVQDVPEEMKKRHFIQQGNTYKVKEYIKQCITYKKHNLLADKYPTNMDLIVCRNVLIYFTEEAKNSIYHHFSKSLADDGVFFVGSTEQIFRPEKFDLRVMDTFFYTRK
ncbi:CheR family methyltransferase [Gracilibacillus dipsosauri]|uniref:protein-glutamate O-methyltransferase n=1 Tax=Gracilibacillus dipsosauri TaxID=178340 RepID=A0A317L0S0_9BACI|nr:protein-glutamate O-methyltransferase CheR [Gracilibacillus dipsosauri]PWU68640.1 chemotaxis protein CheR [Gracilibacillus dipsosauri]